MFKNVSVVLTNALIHTPGAKIRSDTCEELKKTARMIINGKAKDLLSRRP
jgi:hypothetical protein